MGTQEAANVVFMVNLKSPVRPIRQVKVRLINRKFCWAEDLMGRRHLVGASAFFTMKNAQRAKYALLKKFVKDTWVKRWYPDAHQSMVDQIKKYEATGEMT